MSDLYRMTKLNVVNEAIEYIPKKTKEGNPVTVRVPLNDKAKEILERYKEYEGKLLPFISEQKYNDAIKKIFKLAGVDRIVTILDPLTHNEIKRPIYEVASSHLARRTFIGNIYKKVKDPNLVSALSGHKEGSSSLSCIDCFLVRFVESCFCSFLLAFIGDRKSTRLNSSHRT